MSVSNPVNYRLDGQVAHIAMNDGKLNVMSLEMLEALHAAFDRAASDKAVVAFSSAQPNIFSAGFDLKVFAANDVAKSQAMVRAGAELALKLLSFQTPILSICRGHAFPMGAFLLLASDIRIGVAGAYRIGLNEVAIGIPVPSFALELARHRLHPAYLSRTAMTGEMFGPEEAVMAGFLDRIVPADALEATIDAVAASLTQIHMPSHATVKQRLRARAIMAVRAAIDAELTPEAYRRYATTKSAVKLPGAA